MDEPKCGNRYEGGANLFDKAAECARVLWDLSKKAPRPTPPDPKSDSDGKKGEEYQKIHKEMSLTFRQKGNVHSLHLRRALLNICDWSKEYSPDPLSECLASLAQTGTKIIPEELWLSATPPRKPDDDQLDLRRIYHNPNEIGWELIRTLALVADHCRKLACRAEHSVGK